MHRLANMIRFLVSGELIFALFLLSGFYKGSLDFLPPWLDVTVVFLCWSLGIATWRTLHDPYLVRGSLLAISLYCLLAVAVVGSLAYTVGLDYAVEKSLRFLVITGWAYLGVFFLFKTPGSLQKLFHIFIAFSVLMTAASLSEFTGKIGSRYLGFTSAFGSNYLSLGKIVGIGMLCLIILYMYRFDKRGKNTIFAGCLISVMAIALLVAGGRMPLLAFVCVLVLLTLSSAWVKKGIINVKKGLGYLVLLAVFFLAMLVPLAEIGVFETVSSRIMVLMQDDESATNDRTDRMAAAAAMAESNPILGQGIGSFPIYYSHNDIPDYPHNIFLELGAELGIVGLAIFVMMLVNALRHVHFSTISLFHLTVLAIFFYLFLNANVSGDLNDNRMLFTFLALLAVTPYLQAAPNLQISKTELIHSASSSKTLPAIPKGGIYVEQN